MFIKPEIDFTKPNGANVSSTNFDSANTSGECYQIMSVSNDREESVNIPPSWTTRTLKQDTEQTGNLNKRYACGYCGMVIYDTMQEIKQHMIEELDCISHKRFAYSRTSNDDYDEEAVDQIDYSIKPSTSSSTVANEQSSYRSSSSCEDEPLKNSPPNLKGTRRTRAKKVQPEQSAPSEEESDQEEDFLQTVTLKSLTEKFQYEKPHKCSRKGCPYKFASYDIRDQHLRCHAENDSMPEASDGGAKAGLPRKRFSFKCSQCDDKFDSWKPCLMHVWREHQIDLGMLRCPVCEKRFVYTVHVFKHLQTHRLNQTLDVSCRVCGKKFVNTSQRAVHEALHRKKDTHEDEEELEVKEKLRWYAERRCNICKHMFSNSKILSKHIKTVHLKIKPFVCNVCGYKCARKATLNIHIRQHSGLKPLTCKSCPFRTADPSALSYHERRHRNEKAYQCKTCGIRLVQPSALRCHIQTQHPKEYQQMKCTLCDYASINAQNLKRHQANHKAGLIKSNDEDSQMECDIEREHEHGAQHGRGMSATDQGRQPQNAPEISFDCFLPPESVDSVVHDTGGITIPAAVVTLPAALSEETQFPI
ncbi:zinc finger protein 846 [Anopheles moucheti]|uniref:zinc finger protein 846 n=1 Tax=Anopheles moucheti TaxID=186751 RepID=UPI0022F0E1AA|nr:zinc finger protein 846 [Anopheles moucheti]